MSFVDLVTRQHGLGWIPNPPDKRDWDVDRLGMSAVGLPAEVDLMPHVRAIRGQGAASSCVGESLAGAVCICESKAGLYSGPASSFFPYYHSRREVGPVVLDVGARIRSGVRMMVKLGIPDEQYWPSKLLMINRRPSWEAHMMAHPRRGGTYYAINDYGHERVLAAQTALAHDRPIVFGAKVTRDFLKDRGPEIVDRPLNIEPIAGGHAMVLVGYRTDPDWGLLFRALNSWGDDWRLGGTCWLTEAYIRWIHARDFTIIEAWDRLRKAA